MEKSLFSLLNQFQPGLVDRAGGDFCGLARAKVADTKDQERRARMAANLAAIERERGNLATVTAK